MHLQLDLTAVWKSKATPGSSKPHGAERFTMSTQNEREQKSSTSQNEEVDEVHASTTTPSHSQSDNDHGPLESTPTQDEANAPQKRGRKDTLSTRRRISRPPEPLETMPSNIKAIDTAKRTAENENRKRQEYEARTPTPTTGDLKAMLESYEIESPEVGRLMEMYGRMIDSRVRAVRERRKRVGGRNDLHRDVRLLTSTPQRTKGVSRSGSLAAVTELRVKQRMLPAMVLLSRPAALTTADVKIAAAYAHSALKFARDQGVVEALQARCAYYVALAEYLLANKDERGLPLSLSGDRTPNSAQIIIDEKPTPLAYFEQASAAKGVYIEGQWAEEWVQYLNHLLSTASASSGNVNRPTSRDGWMGSLWRKVWKAKDQSLRLDTSGTSRKVMSKMDVRNYYAAREVVRSSTSTANEARGTFERLPSFPSRGTDDSSTPASRDTMQTSGKESPIQSEPDSAESVQSNSLADQRPAGAPVGDDQATSPQLNRNPPNLIQPIDPEEDILPLPVTAPNHSRTRSTTLTNSLKDLVSSASSTLPKQLLSERRHSRKPSLLALVTGRDRRSSELEQAEEGHSPFRGTFEGVDEECGGLKRRKTGSDPGDMV